MIFLGMIDNLKTYHITVLAIKLPCQKFFSSNLGYPRPCGFRQEDFFHVFHHISLCKTCDPRSGANFGPRGMI